MKNSLKVYLIKNFIITIVCIGVSEQILSAIYREILPILFTTFGFDTIKITGTGSVIVLVMEILLLFIVQALPIGVLDYVVEKIQQMIQSHWQFSMVSQQSDNITTPFGKELFAIFCLLVIIGLLIILLLPYLIGGIWYYKKVSDKIEELIREEQEQKAQYDRARNLMLSDITHDIKTPITTICGYAKLLTDGVVKIDENKKHEYLKSIYDKSMRMSELITMLFEYIKMDSEGFELHKEKIDLADLLRESVAELYSDFENNGMILDVDITEELCPYNADKLQLSRVFTNILNNAIKYNETGTKIKVSMDEDLKIKISDSGIPIDDEFAKVIFDPFSRGDKSRNTKGGSGLGLSISKKIVEMHGGTIRLNNNCEPGFTKSFEIVF